MIAHVEAVSREAGDFLAEGAATQEGGEEVIPVVADQAGLVVVEEAAVG